MARPNGLRHVPLAAPSAPPEPGTAAAAMPRCIPRRAQLPEPDGMIFDSRRMVVPSGPLDSTLGTT